MLGRPPRTRGGFADFRQDSQGDWLARGFSAYRAEREMGLEQRGIIPATATATTDNDSFATFYNSELPVSAATNIASTRPTRATRQANTTIRNCEPFATDGGFLGPDTSLPKPLCCT